jgi:hypothetical protein
MRDFFLFILLPLFIFRSCFSFVSPHATTLIIQSSYLSFSVLFNKKAIADQQAQLSRDAKTAIRKAKRAAVRASQHLSSNDRYSSEEEEEHDNKGAGLLGVVKKKDREREAAEGLVLLSGGSDDDSGHGVGVGHRSAGHTGSRPPIKKKSVKFAAAPVWR